MSTVFGLVKIFDRPEYAQAFMRGRLRLGSLRAFRDYRDPEGVLRGDPWEGVTAIFQPAQLGEVVVGEQRIAASELRGPVTIVESLPGARIFCAYALHSHHLDKISSETLGELKSLVQVHRESFGFGDVVALVYDTKRFFERIDSAIAREGRGYRGLMHYFDETRYHGRFEQPGGFNKRISYANQREYRFMVDPVAEVPDPFFLEVGDLSDIVTLTTVAEFNDQLKLSLPDGSVA